MTRIMSSSFHPRAFTSSELIGRNFDVGVSEERYFSDLFPFFSFFLVLFSNPFSGFFSTFSGNLIFSISDFILGFDPDFKASIVSTFMGTNKPIFLYNLTLFDFSITYFLFPFGNGLFVGIICFQAPHFLRFQVTQML